MKAGMLGTLKALWDVFPLFTNTKWGENSNIGFLKKHMGASFEQRPQPWVTNVSDADIQSGDFLALSKIRGRWGGFETLEKWVSGAYAGHSAVCLRDSEGKLWVAESGHEDEEVIYQTFLKIHMHRENFYIFCFYLSSAFSFSHFFLFHLSSFPPSLLFLSIHVLVYMLVSLSFIRNLGSIILPLMEFTKITKKLI